MITIKDPQDVLLLIPHLLGYTPQKNFLVFCGFDACLDIENYSCRCFLARPLLCIDCLDELPCNTEEKILTLIRLYKPDASTLIFYCENLDILEGTELGKSLRRLHKTIESAMSDTDEDVRVIAYATDNTSYRLIDTRDGKKFPCAELSSHVIAEQNISEGVYGNSLCVSLGDPQPVPAHISRRIRQGAESAEQLPKEQRMDAFEYLCRTICSPPPHGNSKNLAHWERISWEQLGIACAEMDNPYLRDLVLILAMGNTVWEENTASRNEEGEYGIDIAQGLETACGVLPDLNVISSSVKLLDVLGAQDIPGNSQALAVCAYLCWWACDFGAAIIRVQLACQEDPSNRLAQLLSKALNLGLNPPWCHVSSEKEAVNRHS